MENASDTRSTVWTVQHLLQWTTEFLTRKGVDEARLAAEILLSSALKCQRIQLYTRFDLVPDDDQLAVFRDLVRRAAEHAPIAHLVGRKEFYSLSFTVSPDVLIPRPETEILVQQVIEFARRENKTALTFFELGTGSGCISVSILKLLPEASAVATDINDAALAIASQNATEHGVDARLQLIRADGLNLPADSVPPSGFDCIVSNPPYVAESEMDQLPRTVRDHEPHIALTDESDGLTFYRLLAERGADLLAADGSVFVEIGEGQCESVIGLFTAAGRFCHCGTWRDLAGPHDRVLRFARS